MSALMSTIEFSSRGVDETNYSDQAQLAYMNGRLYASWSLGFRGEEEPVHAMVLATR